MTIVSGTFTNIRPARNIPNPPAAIEFIQAAANGNGDVVTGSTTTDFTGFASEPAEGNLIILMWAVNTSSDAVSYTSGISSMIEATALYNSNATSEDFESYVHYKIAGASEGTPLLTFTNAGGTNRRLTFSLMEFANVHADVFDVTPSSSHTNIAVSGGGTGDPVSITFNGPGMSLVSHVITDNPTTATPPTGYTTASTDIASSTTTHTAYKVVSAAGAQDPDAFATTGVAGTAENGTTHIALKQA